MTKAEAYLRSLEKFGIKPGLDRINHLLDRLGHPERSFNSILVAGTNGKGSVAALLSSVLSAAGYKAGLYTSPHIFSYTERIRVNHKDIPKAALDRLILKVKKIACSMADPPTIFEVLTAVAFEFFRQQKVKIAILEVGMGGRLDCTNVVDPLVSVITQIDYDHTEVLGKTLAKIAAEKAGIIKSKGEVVIGELLPAALQVISKQAKAKQARIFKTQIQTLSFIKQDLSFQYLKKGLLILKLPLLGKHQIHNLAVALEVLDRLKVQGFEIQDQALQKGVRAVKWPLRFQVLSKRQPLLILDAAHNVSGARALVQTLKSLNLKLPIVFYLGVLKRKDYRGIVKTLAAEASGFFVSGFSDPGAATAKELLAAIGRQTSVKAAILPLAQARAKIQGELKDKVVCVTGSIYFVSEFLKAFGRG